MFEELRGSRVLVRPYDLVDAPQRFEAMEESRAFSIGYWIRSSAEGHGYVTEAVELVVKYAFDVLEAQRIEIICDLANVRTVAVTNRLGFQLEGRVRNVYRYPNGNLCDELIFSLIPSDRPR